MKTDNSNHSNTKDPFAYGLAALLDNGHRVSLPLRAIDTRFNVTGDCAEVRLQQEFEHDGPNPVNVVYAFPLPSEAAVHECVMTIGDRRIVAKVKPSAEARANYDLAQRSGKRAALVESLRDNLFELHLGNVQPGDAIRIDFSYAQPLTGIGFTRELRIPVSPGIRFAPGRAVGADGGTDLVPDAGRLARARIGSKHPDAAVFYCAGKLTGIKDLESPSHEIEEIKSANTVAVMLSRDEECPDRDFVLTWTADAVTTALSSRGDLKHVLCSVSATGLDSQEPDGREILFLLDSSGSMSGDNWIGLLEAMDLALAQLRDSDQFSIRLFNSGMHDLSDGWNTTSAANLRQAMSRLRSYEPTGGTNFTEAFAAVLGEAADLRRPVVVVITDGQFGDEERATRTARDSGVEVHTFGIDANVNEGVLRKIARRTHGTCSLVSPGQDLADKVHHLMEWLLAPSIHRIKAVGPWQSVANPPSLRNGQSALVAFRYTGEGSVPTTINIDLELADGSMISHSFPVTLMEGAAASVLATKFEVEALIDEGFENEAVKLACHRNILAQGASFVAVDDMEKVVVATARIEQANLVPASMQLSSARNRSQQTKSLQTNMGLMGFVMNPMSRDEKTHTRHYSVLSSRGGDTSQIEMRASFMASQPTPRRENQSQNLKKLASRIVCFDQIEWEQLITDYLLPWATENRVHERLLLDVFSELENFGMGREDRCRALEVLLGLLPFLKEPTYQKVEAFIDNH